MKKYSVSRPELIKQALLFGIVGIATLAIDIVVSSVLFYGLHLPAYIASAAGFLSAFIFNFPVNRKRVFKHSENDKFSLHAQAMMYVVLCVFNLFITSILVDVMVNTDLAQIQYAKVIVTILIAIWNFILFKTVIFSKD